MPLPYPTRPAVFGLFLSATLGTSASLGAQAPIDVRSVPVWHARWGHSLAFDPDRGRVVLFGHANWPNLDPVWEWDGARWAYLEPRGPAPSLRYDHGMTFDPVGRRIVMFGGYDGRFTLFDETWAWDGRAWTLLTPITRPPARWGHSMVTDEARNRVVMFGGSLSTWHSGSDETWEWDGRDWTQVATGVRPPPRTAQAMAYDRQARRVLLYGGWRGVVPYGDTWAYDGNGWQQLSAGDPGLTPRVGHAMATDVGSGRVVLYGGHEGSGAWRTDTWTWTGSGWQAESSSPYEHPYGRMASDGQRVILFGGYQTHPNPYFVTSGWDGSAWTVADDPGYLGNGGGFELVAYHAGLQAFVVGQDPANQPPVFQVLGNDGELRHAGAIPPNGLRYLGYDVARDRLIGLDRNLRTAWAWDRRTWTRLPDPPLMYGVPGASWWEPRTGRLVFWLRSSRLIDWDGAAWSERSIAGTPMTREGVIVAHDPERDRLLAYGGKFQQTFFPETWEWDGSTWTLKDASGPFRAAIAMVYGGEGRGMLLFRGGDRSDIWSWNGTNWSLFAASGLRILGEGNIWRVVPDPSRNRLLVAHGAIPPPAYPALDEISLAPLNADQPYPRLGETVTLSAELPADGGHQLLVGLSTAVDPGIPVRPNAAGTWDLFPAAATPLLFASLQTAPIDIGGKASVTYRIPVNRALWWMRLYGAGIAVGPGPTLGSITNTAKLWIVR